MRIDGPEIRAHNITKLNRLLEAVRWDTRSPRLWRSDLSKSEYVYYAWDGQYLAGFGRGVIYLMDCMLYDVCVHPSYRREGIGTKIVGVLYSLLTLTTARPQDSGCLTLIQKVWRHFMKRLVFSGYQTGI